MSQPTIHIGLGSRILGLVLVFSGAVSALYLLWWQPTLMEAEMETLREYSEQHARMTAKALEPVLLKSDFDAMNDLLDSLQTGIPEWNYVDVVRPDGRSLYQTLKQLEKGDVAKADRPPEEDCVFWLDETIRDQEVTLARLEVTADVNLKLQRLRRKLQMFGITLLAGVLGLAGALAYLLNRSVRQPVIALSAAFQKFARGDFQVELPPASGDEVGSLINGFDRMRHDLARQHEELKAARDEAERANEAKSRFLATASHELRTPLGVILGFSSHLENNASDPDEIARVGTVIARNGRYLLELVNQILDLAKLESGEFLTERQTTDLESLLEEIQTVAQSQLEGKPVTCRVDFDREIPGRILLDSLRLKQILFNLVSNATRFTDEGQVLLRARQEWADDLRMLRIDVEDTGNGIDPAVASSLFQPFCQGSDRQIGGTGLGLTIAREIAQFLGGDVQARENAQGGSVFTLTIPFVESTADPLHPLPSGEEDAQELTESIRGARVLLAEDYDDAADLMLLEFKKLGLLAKRAANGREAVELVKHSSFDFCLMDIQMPLMDGYQATRELRKLGFAGPIIALTAHAMRGDREVCLAAGCDDYESKPVDMRRLAEKIVRALARRGIKITPPADPMPSSVEDDYDMQIAAIARQFFESLPGELEALELSFDSGDTEKARSIAHNLAGAASARFAPNLAEAARQLEQAIRTNGNPAELRDSCDALKAAMNAAARPG